MSRRSNRSASAALALVVAMGAVDHAHAQPAPDPVPGQPVPKDEVPPIIKPGDRNDPRRPRTLRTNLDNEEILRNQGGKPGVIDTGTGGDKGFQAGGETQPDGGVPGDLPPAVGDSETKLEEVVEWKTNFEQGIKCKKIPLDAKIRLDFNEITLGDLTKFISCVTEQNFLLTGGVNRSATVSILSPKPVTAYEAYKAYLSALEANGLTIVPNGKFLEIVASGEARSKGGPIYGVNSAGPNTDQMVTRLVQLDHIPAEEILPVIEKFKTGAADITIYGPTNTMIITDTGSNIRRLLKLVTDLDVPIGKERIWIRPVVNASASEIATLLGQIIGESAGAAAAPAPTGRRGAAARAATVKPNPAAASPGGDGGGTSVVGAAADLSNVQVSKMIADERTNSLIFVATRTAYLQVDKIIRKLDVAIPGEGSIHIHPLENADAEEISQTLSALTGNRSGGATTSRRGAANAGTPAGSGSAAPAGGAVGEMFEGDVKITAYKPKNSLVIESSLKDYLSLQKVIRQLDVRRKQVYVEAIVMEIAQNKDRSIGFSGSGGTTFDVDGETIPLLFGAGGLAADLQGIADTLGKGGGAAGLIGPPVDIPAGGVSGGTVSVSLIGFTLKALQTTTNVNVLSTPHILTLENEEAEIQVGKRRPYSTLGATSGGLGNLGGLLGGLGGLGTTGTNTGGLNLGGLGGLGALGLGGLGGLGGIGGVQYVDIDLTLKIKPTVNASDFVRMEIDQSIDDIDGLGVGDAPITSKRKVTNVVEVKDGQAVVIGGLIRDQESESVSKVPFLGDIPLVGLLFRKTTKTVEKRNLIMIIIPHVIKDPSDLKRLHEKRMEEYRTFARTMAEREKEYQGELDYRKKSGLLHDVHKTVVKARAERDLRERTLYDATDIDPVGPPETHDIEYDPRDAVKGEEPAPTPAPKKGAAPKGGR